MRDGLQALLGLTSEIAHTFSRSARTVETYRSRAFHKLGLSDLPALVTFAIRHGLTPPA